MKPTSTSEVEDRADTTASGAEPPASFERLLELLVSTPLRTGDRGADIRAALERIAAFFEADRADLRLDPGREAALDLDPPPAEKPDLEVPIAVAGREPIGTVNLYAPGRKEPWTERDEDRLRLAAWTLCEVLHGQRIESDLREQQIWLLMAMDSAAAGVWDWDLTTDRVRYVSSFDVRVGRLCIQERRASTWLEETHREDVKVSRPEVDRAIAGETDVFSMVVRQRVGSDADARWVHVYSRGRVIERDAAGRARRIMGTFENVTEAHLEAEARREREAAMARTARMASLGALASSLAHDLNQPLTALTSYLEGSARLISNGKATDADVVEAVERSVAFAHRASDIVRSFRRLLQREAPMRDPVVLSSLMAEVQATVKREAAAADVEVAVPQELDPAIVRGDGLQIEQVLVNLVRNAIEALEGSKRLPRTVVLDVRAVDRHVEVRVSDNGPGIPAAVVDRVFEPLVTSKESGRGLGLAICHSIAEIHGGRLYVERTGPDGTTFVLTLPSDDGGHR